MIKLTSTWKCHICRQWHTMTDKWHNQTFCPVWSVFEHGDKVVLNAYNVEMDQQEEIDLEWERLVRRIESDNAIIKEHKVRCNICHQWFISFFKAGSCLTCATVPEEVG